jgi:glycosyltransferase involved in cell wall biosynthesis
MIAFLTMKKIAIYDRYLSTTGGGERYSCKMAEILSKAPGYSVHLITDIFADMDKISKTLNLDLSKVKLKLFPYISDDYARRLTGQYDLFINATYLSALSPYSKKNIYLCYFPTPFDVDFRFLHRFLLIFFRLPALWLFRLAARLTGDFTDIGIEEGLYEPKRFMLRRGGWSNGFTSLLVKGNCNFRLGIKNPSQSLLGEMKVKVTAYPIKENGTQVKKQVFKYEEILKKGQRQTIDPGLYRTVAKYRIIMESDTFIPSAGHKSTADSRKLGAVLYNESETGIFKKIILKAIGYVPLFLTTFPRDHKFLDSYQKIVSISEYSSYWIEKYWKKKSTILFPPVDIKSFAPEKNIAREKSILSVGRFFPEHHNKKQYELASAFIDMVKKNPEDLKGYTLYMAGGLEDRPGHAEYVKSIRKMSEGYPVKVLTNISFDRLAELFRKASIFWHASGLGEDEQSHPEKFEHFGITTVEAMSAGCIPVVIEKGGQKEIVTDGIDGFLFRDIEELKEKTLDIIKGKLDEDALRRKALASCRKFSNERFAQDLLSIVKDVI